MMADFEGGMSEACQCHCWLLLPPARKRWIIVFFIHPTSHSKSKFLFIWEPSGFIRFKMTNSNSVKQFMFNVITFKNYEFQNLFHIRVGFWGNLIGWTRFKSINSTFRYLTPNSFQPIRIKPLPQCFCQPIGNNEINFLQPFCSRNLWRELSRPIVIQEKQCCSQHHIRENTWKIFNNHLKASQKWDNTYYNI